MRYCSVLCCLVLLPVGACGVGSAPTHAPLDKGAIERIIVYADGERVAIQPGGELWTAVADHLLTTVSTFSLPAECVLNERAIEALKQQESVVELEFAGVEKVTLGERLAKEDQERTQADDRGFRVVESDKLLFVLSGEHRGQLLVPLMGEPPTWGCWAVVTKNELDTRWVEATESLLTSVESSLP